MGEETVQGRWARMRDEGQLEEHRILVDKFETEPAVAECALGLTINLGNYESLRIDVGAKIPCYKEELVQAHQEAFRNL